MANLVAIRFVLNKKKLGKWTRFFREEGAFPKKIKISYQLCMHEMHGMQFSSRKTKKYLKDIKTKQQHTWSIHSIHWRFTTIFSAIIIFHRKSWKLLLPHELFLLVVVFVCEWWWWFFFCCWFFYFHCPSSKISQQLLLQLHSLHFWLVFSFILSRKFSSSSWIFRFNFFFLFNNF